MKIALTGGGSGGHAAPAIAVAEALRLLEPQAELLYIGSRGGMEEGLAQRSGLSYRGITARKIQRATPLAMVGVGLSLVRGLAESIRLLRSFGPDAILGTGGYAAASAVRAACALGIPAVIHEQNVMPGRTNRWLARFGARVCISTPAGAAHWPAGEATLTGLPLRSAAITRHGAAEARSALGFDPARPVLLVMGGSQGAQSVNAVVYAAAPLLPEAVQVLHQTGAAGIDAAQRVARSLGPDRYACHAFMDADLLSMAYASATAALCRCGASTLAECHVHGVPTLMTPLPSAYADHQRHNALEAEAAGAGILLPQAELTAERLVAEVSGLLAAPDRLRALGDAAQAMAAPDAAERVARLLLETASRRR
ncbi:MAG: undecaprenyldiphospho-muramoylpentapeptide beta-N-acetylglucosaminyltransferase [Armatimonadetes bacterium]|nr:undecaprenyldiphospho-muramoylpentapeptide beta-N-acetylglucosaminyltransferase [Armatimonadota bacterium]